MKTKPTRVYSGLCLSCRVELPVGGRRLSYYAKNREMVKRAFEAHVKKHHPAPKLLIEGYKAVK